MKHIRPLVVAIIALLACLSPALQLSVAIGVNVHIVARTSAPASEIADSRALIASVPKGTDLRDDLNAHEAIWDREGPIDMSGIRQKIDILAPVGGTVTFNLTLIPWPGSGSASKKWLTTDTWGYVAEEDIPDLVRKGSEIVAQTRAYWKSKGRKETDLRFQIGNELGTGHPGGFPGLMRGQWSRTLGELYRALLRDTLFGRCPVIGPAVSFNDEPPEVRDRELATFPVVYKLLRPYLDYCAVHSRTYAPWLNAYGYAKLNRSDAVTRAGMVAKLTNLPCVVTENYVGVIDTPDQGAALDELRKLPTPVPIFYYRFGEGDWLFSLPKGKVFRTATADPLK